MEQIQSGTPVKVITSKGVLNAHQVVITAGVCIFSCYCACYSMRDYVQCLEVTFENVLSV